MTNASSVENVQKPVRCKSIRWKNQTARNASAAADAAKPARQMQSSAEPEEITDRMNYIRMGHLSLKNLQKTHNPHN